MIKSRFNEKTDQCAVVSFLLIYQFGVTNNKYIITSSPMVINWQTDLTRHFERPKLE